MLELANGGYVEQDGCRNCGLTFIHREYDEGWTYYCHRDGADRPPCMSVLMGEFRGTMLNPDEEDAAYEAWDTWAEGREVAAWGKCAFWKCASDHDSACHMSEGHADDANHAN